MARALLLALAFAVASGARYVDYSGVKMPQYGGTVDYEGPRDSPAPPEDYLDRPDAPVSLADYKYEEENGKTEGPSPSDEDSEVWQKPAKKKHHSRLTNDALDHPMKYNADEDPPFTNQHFSKHRPRLKSRNPVRDEEPQHSSKHIRSRNDESNVESKHFQNDLQEDRSIDFDDVTNDSRKPTTARVARRRPRDQYVPQKGRDELERDDVMRRNMFKKDKRLFAGYPDYDSAADVQPEGLLRRPSGVDRRNQLPNFDLSDNDELSGIAPPNRRRMRPANLAKSKSKDEYSDYYDMKRVQGIRERLPNLLRRTKARIIAPTKTWPMAEPTMTPVWPYRRMVPHPESPTTETTTPTSTTTMPTTTTTTEVPTRPRVLSLGEKSRLSILKKAERKEDVRNGTGTKKPPVLLQVTDRMQTLVMVEPPTSMEPWFRAREVEEETPERIEKVKKMMRQRLVANAKNIRDLTDNWDEMVCDYVDLKLLDNDATIHRLSAAVAFLVLLIFIPIRI